MSKPLTLAELSHPSKSMIMAARAGRIRRRSGAYPPGMRLPCISYEASLAIVAQDMADRATRQAAADTFAAERRTSMVAQIAKSVAEHQVKAREAAVAWRAANPGYNRTYRLKQKIPEGILRADWAEIVDHFKGGCVICGAGATRHTRLADGTPVPACIVHEKVTP